MQMTRDLFPTDAGTPYFTLTLESRDHEAHSLLSGLGEADRTRIGEVLAEAVSAMSSILREAIAHEPSSPGTSSFGCGT